MPPGDLASCAGETPPCPCRRPGSVFARETAPLVCPGSGTGLGGCRATLCSVFRHLTSYGRSGPSSRTSSPPSTSISSGETRGRGEEAEGVGAKDSPNGTSRVHASASVSPPASQGQGSVLRGRSAAGAALKEPGVHAPALPAWRAITLSLPPPAALGP